MMGGIIGGDMCIYCTLDTAGQHQPGCLLVSINRDVLFWPMSAKVVTYPPQPEQIIRPTEHAILLRLIDGLRQTMERRGLDVGDGSAVAVVSAAEMVIRQMEDK